MCVEDILQGCYLQALLGLCDRSETWALTHVSNAYAISSEGVLMRLSDGFRPKPYKNAAGYIMDAFSDGQRHHVLAHTLVAHAFLKPDGSRKTVDHLDRNRENNSVSNLRWANRSEQNANRRSYAISLPKRLQNISVHKDGVHIGTYTSSEDLCDALGIPFRKIFASSLRKYTRGDLRGYELRDASEKQAPDDLVLARYANTSFKYEYKLSRSGVLYGKEGVMHGRDQHGYRLVVLRTFDGGRLPILLHRLVAYTFLNPPEAFETMVVNHKDGNRANNSVDNLEWCTRSENLKHARYTLNTHLLKPVAAYDALTGNLIQTYASVTLAEKDRQMASATLRRIVRNGKPHKGIIWVDVQSMDETPAKLSICGL